MNLLKKKRSGNVIKKYRSYYLSWRSFNIYYSNFEIMSFVIADTCKNDKKPDKLSNF